MEKGEGEMKMNRTVLVLLYCFLLAPIFVIDGVSNQPEVAAGTISKKVDACGLLKQEEVDHLFGQSVGPGRPDSPVANIQGCVWPADGIPKFLLQVTPAPTDVKNSIDPGEGYRVIDVEGLSGKAAAAIQLANPKYNIVEGISILGIARGEHMVTLSPVMLNIQVGSPQFELLKKLADRAAQRLSSAP
jgi:hypothetical protein